MSDATVCPINITAAGRRRRFLMGAFVITATVTAYAVVHPPTMTAWILLPTPLLFGWLCVLQAAMRT